jgi:putative DNA-invertase from lambdoid prophage Rac
MRVVGYCRVSTSEQADDGSSLASQRQQITGYAMMKGWEVDEFFVEAGVSGSVPLADRVEGHRLLASLQAGDIIVSSKLDRAFRSAADALGTLEQLKEDKVGLHLIDLGGDVTGNGISKMVFTILAAVAEGERDRIRERIRDAKRHLASKGIFSGGKRPFGTDIVKDGDVQRLVPNAAEQAVIEQMKTMRANGATFREIGKEVGMFGKTVARILDRVDREGVTRPVFEDVASARKHLSKQIEAQQRAAIGARNARAAAVAIMGNRKTPK